ncbi:MAG TPA: hypothetical protein EYP10_05755, partial [Armatimonadetes bacterium]|nr:hypothetical protein [Armatimonadota bacterium]
MMLMQLSNLIALASAIFSWQIAVLFLAFYIGLTRRQVHFLFALLSFALGMMAFCSFMSTSIVQPSAMLYWERAEHAVHFVTAGIFVHFVVTFMGQSLSLPAVSSMYVVCVGLGFLAFTPAFLHIGWVRAPGVSPHPVLRPGPLYPLMLWSFALLLMPAWVLIRQWTRQMERKDEEVESHAEGLEDAEATDGAVELMQSDELRLILIGSIAVVTLSWLDLGMAIADVSIPIRLHPLGALLLSILSAIAVGRRAIHAELERRELITLLRAR